MRRALLLTVIILVAILSNVNVSCADDVADALVLFAEAGDLEKVRYLVLEKGAKANSRDSFGRIALPDVNYFCALATITLVHVDS